MGSRVLVADDDPDVLGMVAAALASEGHEVTTARDGQDAIAKLRGRPFDVVVSDVRMPGASGFDVLALCKQLAPSTEVILTTAYASVPAAVECLRSGGFDFVQKPINLDELLATVDRACEYARLRLAADALLATNDAAGVPRVVVEAAVECLRADDATLLTPGGDGRLHVAYASGPDAAARAGATVPIGEGVAGRVAVDGAAVLLQGDAQSDPRFSGAARSARGVRSSIVYPLAARGRLVAVLCINRLTGERPFRGADLRVVAILAAQTVLALENAGMVTQRVILERMAAVGRAAADVVHEVSNPLSCMLASLEFVRAAMDGTEAAPGSRWAEAAHGRGPIAEAVDDALDSARRVREIVGDVRSMARAEVPGATRFELDEVLRSAVRLARTTMVGQPSVHVDAEGELDVAGNARAISQVLINLLLNAADALDERANDPPRIVVTARRLGDRVVVVVEDNGPGVAPEHLARIFEPFFTTRVERGGAGLGLAISRDIVRRHGGELTVDSTPGRGARFCFTLPFVRDDAAPPGERGPSAPAPPQPPNDTARTLN